MAAKRASTGSERPMAMSDKFPRYGPARLSPTATIQTETVAPTPQKAYRCDDERGPTRQKAYHFDDEPEQKSADMDRTANALVSHEAPARRQTVLSPHPIPTGPQAPTVNHMKNPIFRPPSTIVPNVVQWVVSGVQGDPSLGSYSALLVGPVASRTSSLTHVVPSRNRPAGALTSFLPLFFTQTGCTRPSRCCGRGVGRRIARSRTRYRQNGA